MNQTDRFVVKSDCIDAVHTALTLLKSTTLAPTDLLTYTGPLPEPTLPDTQTPNTQPNRVTRQFVIKPDQYTAVLYLPSHDKQTILKRFFAVNPHFLAKHPEDYLNNEISHTFPEFESAWREVKQTVTEQLNRGEEDDGRLRSRPNCPDCGEPVSNLPVHIGKEHA